MQTTQNNIHENGNKKDNLMFNFKKLMKSKLKVQRESHLYDLKEVAMPTPTKVNLRFKVFKFSFEHNEAIEIMKILYNSIQKISINFSGNYLPKFQWSEEIQT